MSDVAWPLIGVTARVETEGVGGEPPRVLLKRTYPETLAHFGAVPLVLPCSFTRNQLRAAYERLDAILLPGGLDVHPSRYGAQPIPRLGRVDAALDEADLTLARWALDDGKPLLGLCRGQQVLNVALGGTLYQDLETEHPSAEPEQHLQVGARRYAPAHDVTVAPDSGLAAVLGTTRLRVNSVHHQAVREVGSGWRATAWANDGVIEAIEPSVPIAGFALAVQCHPEELWADVGEPFCRLFEAFVHAARTRAGGRG